MAVPTQSATQGFYVFQTTLGSPLQFHPALGTPELDALMDAYLPYPATAQEKRASISVDFLNHYRCTGESIKFYQVPDYWVNSTTSSPSSAQDSGYGSSFTASPMVPTWSWPAVATPTESSPSTSSSHPTPQMTSRRRKPSSSARQPTPSRATMSDYSHMPGMKILTKDGRDVTNTATRGCKTKEQRDHAHLMRIMKACDSCKRKKVRCDPSHRTGASPTSPTESLRREAKRVRRSNQPQQPGMAVSSFKPPIPANSVPIPSLTDSFEFDAFDPLFLEDTPAEDQVNWDEFLVTNGELDAMFTGSLDYLPDLQPSVLSTNSKEQPVVIDRPGTVPSPDVPQLPYLDVNETPHNYVDFNLYSPSSSVSDADLVCSGDVPSASVFRRSQVTDQQSIRASARGPHTLSTIPRPGVLPDSTVAGVSEISRSSQLQAWLSASSLSPNSLSTNSLSTNSPHSTPSSLGHIDARDNQLLQLSPGLAARVEPAASSSGLYGTNSRDAQSGGYEISPSSVFSLSRYRTETDLPGDIRSTNVRDYSRLSHNSSQLRSFVEEHQANETGVPGASLTARADLRNHSSSGSVRHVAPGDVQCDSRKLVESCAVHLGTSENLASQPAGRASSVLRPAATATASSSQDITQPGLENHSSAAAGTNRSTVVSQTTAPGTNESTTVTQSTAHNAVRASALKPTARALASTDVAIGKSGLENSHTAVGIADKSTTTPMFSQLPLGTLAMVFASAMAAAFTFAAALRSLSALSPGNDVFAGSKCAVWMALSAVAYTLSRQNQKTDGSGTLAKSLRARRIVAETGSVLSRIPVLV
ncbi:uncharacterized protein DNG_06419 [Cephalotrichum gorgonifer]|uniref:Zn(2)-C6 fungal-type domain-containing protein n=1 Tax=Cephalotrichum gorgonifer TaxID=2041049 RepID=A0AAE8SWG1_9PEZI|nr:uncharacterized protein DNG_06419 [Cephalotrichum gorgonifer]